MATAIRVFAVVWAVLVLVILVVATLGALAPGVPVLGPASVPVASALRHFDGRVNYLILVLLLPALVAALWAARRRERDAVTLSPVELAALVRSLPDAASSTTDVAEEQFSRLFGQFFDRAPDGTMQPKTVRVQLDDRRYATVPLVAVVPSLGITLGVLRARFRCALATDADPSAAVAAALPADLARAPLGITVTPRGRQHRHHVVDVTVELKPATHPEVLASFTTSTAPASDDDGRPEPGSPPPRSAS